MPNHMFSLGLPMWANKDWNGSLFAKGTKATNFLHHYASVFNTVEGNTTFYALPSPETVARWGEQTPEGFHFCFKLHRSITHEKRLHHVEEELNHYFRLLGSLESRLGPFLVQLPPSFAPRDLYVLEAFLDSLPTAFQYAVEVRHIDFFKYGEAEERLNYVLASRQIDRVILDARGIHQAIEADEHTQDVQRRKPNLPVHFDTTGPRPMVRYISDPTMANNEAHWHHWAQLLASWRDEGQHPYFFMHVPDNRHSPGFARHFYQLICGIDTSLPPQPDWPGEQPPVGEQFDLFGA